MSEPRLLAIDIGGSGIRAFLVGAESGRVTTAFRSWELTPTPDTNGLGLDVDLDAARASMVAAVREVMARSKAAPDEVRGVAATGMRFGLALLDFEGRVLYAGPNRDARAAMYGVQLAVERGEELHARTGCWPSPIFRAPRLRWLMDQRPDLVGRARALVSLNDWVAFELCGELATDATQAAGNLFDLRERAWASDLIATLELPPHLFPQVRSAGERLGSLRRVVADELGLSPNTPVAVGGADTQCGLVGMGAIADGDVGLVAGTTAPVHLVVDRPTIDPDAALWSGHHLPPDTWVLEAHAGPVGFALSWLARLCGCDLEALLAGAFEVEPGAGGVTSTFGTRIHDGRDLTMPIGAMWLPQTFIGAVADRRHVARATLDAIAFAIRSNVEQLERVGGRRSPRLLVGGGVTRSAGFCRVLSDVLGRPVERGPTPDASALGAAICAGVGAGSFSGVAEGAAVLASERQTFEPDAERSERYDELHGQWAGLRDAQRDAAELAGQHVAARVFAT